MPRRDPFQITGPFVARPVDIPDLNQVFSDAFTARYHRDGLLGVRVPMLSGPVWRFALDVAGEGALLWKSGDERVAAFNMVHLSGREGWMGPLAVRTDLQGQGLGRVIVDAGIAYLRGRGAAVIGLETMPRTIENIGFYCRLGFHPAPMTVTLALPLEGWEETGEPEGNPGEVTHASQVAEPGADAVDRLITSCNSFLHDLGSGLDIRREAYATLFARLGDLTVLQGADGAIEAFALWHWAPLVDGRPVEEIRVLKLGAADLDALERLLDVVARGGARAGGARLLVRAESGQADAFQRLIALGYTVHWTDLRMLLQGTPGATKRPAVVWSNWDV